jgi:NhaP-type Na+/H+ or K+/H+ antiporter
MVGLEFVELIGVIASMMLLSIILPKLAKKIRIHPAIILVGAGIIIGVLTKGLKYNLPPEAVFAIGVIALSMAVFDGTSRIFFKKIPAQGNAIRTVVVTALLNIALVLTLVSANSPDVPLFAIALALILLAVDVKSPESSFATIGIIIAIILLRATSIPNTLREISLSIGIGLILGILVLKTLRKVYHEHLAPAILLFTTLITYMAAELIGGVGILAIATLGIAFGHASVRNETRLKEFSPSLTIIIEGIALIAIGLIAVNVSPEKIGLALLIGIAVVAIRETSARFTGAKPFAPKTLTLAAAALVVISAGLPQAAHAIIIISTTTAILLSSALSTINPSS